MGTCHYLKMNFRTVSGANVTLENVRKINDILVKYCATDIVDAETPRDVDKWYWNECMDSLCATVPDMVFMLTVVSERGNVWFEYYASDFGLIASEKPHPRFDPKWLDAARKRRKNKELEAKEKENMKKAALSKLTAEERAALGV